MRELSRREWAELSFAHPGVDLADPTDAFAQALIQAVGGDPDVWETGTETEALTAYRAALELLPDHRWATRALADDPILAVEVAVCTDMGIAHETFLDWPARSQDLAIATVLKRRDTCPSGRHPREAMTDPDVLVIKRVHCAACAKEHQIDEQFRDAPPDHKVGWSIEAVPR